MSDVVGRASPRDRPARRWWIYPLAWLPFLSINLAAFIAFGEPLGMALRGCIANVLPEAILGTVVVRLPRWLRWPEERRASFFAAHVAVLFAFIVAANAIWAVLISLDRVLFEPTSHRGIDLRLLPWRVLTDVLIYGTLAGLSYAWHNAGRVREQTSRAARAETLRARAELAAMRSQLNPHFILNTMHALVGLVRREPTIAEEALERLGDLLRYSLRIQREELDEVTLRDEWSFVQSYLDLERLRLGARLQLSCDMADATLDCIVPSFAVQTLVENAVRHAIAPRAEGGRLAVKARQSDGRLRIEIQDEGPGLAVGASDGHGLGLRLLRERLTALYEGQASLTLNSGGSGGVHAILDLPARRSLEDA